ncbi:TetR family transcriptional regulator [Paenibacillus sp. GSMTC-2017]|uniref:TetR/AcrR family transcriptional regulator n=1 Tax=Paenibacillus sp. GSMTC-2017 TaxID=2794350 RepID=UPI0018D690A2|nr:TetR/AcrR family transcriptional regulator [Paenibacillus sp. GSMTC-2017]MBH5317869.1 TetR family transcriptional regulator [Paenibacillus sp. GSMTC-2017]
MDSKAKLKRKHILQSATTFILTVDFQSLTLDAVAKEAGVSKGGLLYHFPNKEELLKGLALHIFEQFIELFDSYAAKDDDEYGKWCRAYIQASREDLEHNAALNVGVMSATLLQPVYIQSMSYSYSYMLRKMEEDGIDPSIVSIIRLTIDGMYYSVLYKIEPLQKELLDEVMTRLMNMTRKGMNEN